MEYEEERMMRLNQYKDILDNMIWSFSRLQIYNTCPYAFYLQYIKQIPQVNNAFAQFGNFCHELLNKYFKGELLVFELLDEYVNNFKYKVTENFPPSQHTNLATTYFEDGYKYFQNFNGLPQYQVIESEREVNFTLDKYKFVGYIDLIVKNKNDEIELVDHKTKKVSRIPKFTLESINRRRKSEIYQYLRQLYIYSVPLIEIYHLQPQYLNLNFIRTQEWVRLPFNEDDYEESKQWALSIIEKIYADKMPLDKNSNDFYCNYICSCRHYCEFSDCYLGV